MNVLLFFAATIYGMFAILANYASITLIDILAVFVGSSVFFGIAGVIFGLFLQVAIRMIGHTIVDIVELFKQPEKN